MNTDDSPQDDIPSMPNAPLLVARRSGFQWTTALGDTLPPGWQEHLTDYVIAEATVSLAQSEEPLILTEVKLLDDPRGLYQITTYERSVAVQAAYRAISQSFMETPYDCQLLIKTPVGGRFVTIAAPQPPSPEEWKQLIKKIWFRVVLAGGDLGVTPATTSSGSSVKEQPLYTFKLHEQLTWDEPAGDVVEGMALNEWRREIRLIVDPQQPDMVHAQLGWNDRQPAGKQMTVTGSMPRIAVASRGRQKTRMRRARMRFYRAAALASIQRWLSPVYKSQGRPFWSRLALLATALLLLVLVVFVIIGIIKSSPVGSVTLAASQPSPTSGLTTFPSATATDVPTVGSTAAPVSSPVPKPTEPQAPASVPTRKPQPTATSAPAPTATSLPTSTDTPTPTNTPTPTPTNTPTPTPTNTPTPTPTPTDVPPTPTPTDVPPTPTPTDVPTTP